MRLLLSCLLLIAAAVAGAAAYGWREYGAPGPLAAPAAIVVPHGGAHEVGDALQRAGVVRHGWQLAAAAALTRGQGPLRAAELEFPAAASLREVLAVLRSGKPVQHRLTVPEGWTAMQVTALLERAPALDGAMPPVGEGSVLPETYAYEWGTSRAALLGRMTRAMERAVASAWPERAPDLPLANPAEALVLASIVERETAKPDERPLVAAVYLNRLRRGMKLQSDPTVVYGVSGGAGTLDHGLTRSELDTDGPFNTYRVAGLPPSPICMPSEASLQAVLHPADSPALFFVADGTGGHSFARTEQEHRANVQRWRATERQRARPLP